MKRTASRNARVLLVAAAALAVAVTVPRVSVNARQTSAEASAIEALEWRTIGPANVGGRISVITGVAGDSKVYYVAGANGGVFKTTNGGTTFEPIFDHETAISIGDVAVAPSDPSVLYVGTGEGNPRNNASLGDGVYRSTDGGGHWVNTGLGDTEKIARIRVHPTDPDTAWVCALGREWAPNEERGIFKTVDGGKSWKKVLYIDQDTGCSDIDVNWSNPRILFAGMYSYRRKPWNLDSGGKQTAVYRSIDGGETWQKLSGDPDNGLPTEPMDRIGVSIAQSHPDTVYVISETKTEGELWRTDDGGESWMMVNDDRNLNFRPFYYSDVRADPNNPEVVYTLSGGLSKSTDGGRTFFRIGQGVHGDHQALWIDPADSNRVLSGSDGGWQVSMDGGETFAIINTVAFTQFYQINYDLRDPYYVCGGLQDNGTWCGPSQTGSNIGIQKSDWYTVGGGDGFYGVPLLEEPWIVFATSQGGYVTVRDIRSGRSWNIQPYPNRVGSVGDKMADHKYRFNWNVPIVRDPLDPKTVYFGGNVLFKSSNYGQKWDVISPDLTTNDKSKQQDSGGEVVVDNTAAEFHCTIIAIAPSPLDHDVIWVGTDDGNVQVTRDGGKTWTNTSQNLPGIAPNAWIATVEASHFDAGTAYVAADHHRDGDYAPYAFKTTDYGRTWTPIYDGLPKRGWIHVVREDPKNRNLLYLGTELDVFASWDGGRQWTSIRNNLPPVQVRAIFVHPRENDLVIGTHGRGAFIIDDATPLQKLAEAMTTDATLFDVPRATRWVMWNRDANTADQFYSAPNPPAGAMISYYLKSEPRENVSVVIKDKTGAVVRTLRNQPKQAGVNRVAWDLRMDTPPQPDLDAMIAAFLGPQRGGAAGRGGRGGGRGRGGFGGFGGGAYVLPGEYSVTLRVGGRELTKPVQVRMDPRVEISAEALQEQQDMALKLQELGTKAQGLVAQVDSLTRQLTALQQRLRSQRGPAAAGEQRAAQAEQADLDGAVRAILAQLKEFRDTKLARPLAGLNYRQYPRFQEEVRSVSGMANGDPWGITEGVKLRYTELVAEYGQLADELQAFITNDIARINQAMSSAPYIQVGTVIR